MMNLLHLSRWMGGLLVAGIAGGFLVATFPQGVTICRLEIMFCKGPADFRRGLMKLAATAIAQQTEK